MSLSLSKKEEGSSCTTIGCINNVSVERRGEGGERGEGEEGEREEREEREKKGRGRRGREGRSTILQSAPLQH